MIKVFDKSGLSLQEALRQVQGEKREARQAVGKSERALEAGTDKVDLELSRAIQEQLDVEEMAEERQRRIEKLTRLVQAGEYKPDTDKVARSVGEEIALEILGEQAKGAVE